MFWKKLLFAGIFLTVPAVVFGQGKLDSVQVIDEIKVVASRHSRFREVIPSQQLSGVKLEALSSFSVADAIRFFSGIQIKDYGGIGGLKTVDIRSMGSNHLGVFYDGIQLGNAQNGVIDLGKFSLDNIEEISLYNGQKSEIFQSAKDYGSAGTIYLRSRRPRFAGKGQTNIKGVLKSGSFDLINPSILWEQKLRREETFSPVYLSLNTEYIYSSGKYPFRYRKILPDKTVAWDTTAVRQNGDINSFRIEGGLSGLSEQVKWNTKVYFYNSERGIPGAIVNNIWKRSQRQWDTNFFIQGSYQRQFNRYDMIINFKYAHDRMRYLNPDTTLMYIDNSFLQNEAYISVANKYSILPEWDINISTDYQWNQLSANLKDFVYPERSTAFIAVATAFGIYKFKAQASILSTLVFENMKKKNTAVPENKSEYTPAIFISYKPFEQDLNIRAFYKKIFRMPTFNDLYYTDVGNIKLRPEYTSQYNIGLQFSSIPFVFIRADAYYNEVTDKIIAVPKGNGQYRWMMMNLGYVQIRGLDFSTRIEIPFGGNKTDMQSNAFLQINYTYQRAQDFSNPEDNDPESGTYGGQIAYIPWHNGSVIAGISWNKFDLNYSFIYAGERYHNSSNIRENYEQPWYTHDMTIAKTFNYRKIKIRLSSEVNNILNQYYDVVLNYPMPGRNYKIILKVEL
jgi:hypothetical protein